MVGETLFSIAGNLILAGWLSLFCGLIMSEGSSWSRHLIQFGGWVVPTVMASGWALLFLMLGARKSEGDLFSLTGIAERFSSRDHLFLLYCEALTFSLFIGRWIIEDAREHSLPRWSVMMVLPVQFLFGPLGWLAYLAGSRLAIRRRPAIA